MAGLRYSPLRLGALYLERNHMRALGVDRTSRIARSRTSAAGSRTSSTARGQSGICPSSSASAGTPD